MITDQAFLLFLEKYCGVDTREERLALTQRECRRDYGRNSARWFAEASQERIQMQDQIAKQAETIQVLQGASQRLTETLKQRDRTILIWQGVSAFLACCGFFGFLLFVAVNA